MGIGVLIAICFCFSGTRTGTGTSSRSESIRVPGIHVIFNGVGNGVPLLRGFPLFNSSSFSADILRVYITASLSQQQVLKISPVFIQSSAMNFF